ncbi:type I methionyl aminopeptidase [Clostridium bornimense]|uniref:type I methionyl aminopeptidase n=1 Tax=Clostridium bornimense TaxID=1216932 RepID=UPI001C10AF47|nr:type I methionyl aminopeptidase [Clostridium bornimense]MBU5315926.1 type I methionyl aminopeptidase [Clostridium bornimense]
MIIRKNDNEIQLMRRAGKIVGDTLAMLQEEIKPGISTADLDKLAEEFIISQGAKPSFKGYYSFPATLCTSINEEVIHGIPSRNKILQDGDIISIDCGAIFKGYHGDAARTFPVGKVSDAASNLIRITEKSFFKGIEKAIVGNRLSDISHEIQSYVESEGYSVVRDFVGHGIGRKLHEDPNVPNFGKPGRGPKLTHGMTLAIEPMVNIGSFYTKTLRDNWTVVTSDGALSAHYENTVVILETGVEILTLS